MRDPAFWWRKRSLLALPLRPVAAVYGFVAGRRMRRRGERVGIPVICVGNLTVGGAGKTPTALAIGRILIAAGARPYFLSRGYGGSFAGPIRVDPLKHRARDVGDEPLLLAQVCPTIVAADRVAGARAARDAGATVIVMDDGFQNPSLRKDLALVVVDGRRGIGNGHVLPAGPMRAPLARQLAQADAVLVVGKGDGKGAGAARVIEQARGRGLPIFQGQLAPNPAAAWALAGQRVVAFAGIGDPEKFFQTITAAGITARVRLSFPDHHRYTRADASKILALTSHGDLQLLTTEKDHARMKNDPAVSELAGRSKTLPVALTLDDEDAFRQWVLSLLSRSKPAAAGTART